MDNIQTFEFWLSILHFINFVNEYITKNLLFLYLLQILLEDSLSISENVYVLAVKADSVI